MLVAAEKLPMARSTTFNMTIAAGPICGPNTVVTKSMFAAKKTFAAP
jgi:hypothetical protein